MKNNKQYKQRKENKNRLYTPQDRLKRVVAYRHNEYCFEYWTANRQVTNEDSKNSKDSFVFASESVINKKISSKEKKEAWLNDMASQPNMSFFKSLFLPIDTIDKASHSSYLSMGVVHEFILHAFAWLCFATCMANIYVNRIDVKAYSTISYNFNDTCWLAIRIAIFGIIMTYASYLLVVLFKNILMHFQILHYDTYPSKVMEVDALCSVIIGVAYLFCFIVLWKNGVEYAWLFTLITIGAIGLKTYGLYQASSFSLVQVIGFVCILLVVFYALYSLFYVTFLADYTRILKRI